MTTKTVFSPEMVYNVDQDGGILIFGDTHFSATFSGEHKNYQEECLHTMSRITYWVEEKKPSAVIFLGDFIGVSERNITDKRFLAKITVFLQTLNKATKGNVFIVRGNHDIGDFPDFEYFKSIGLLKTPTEVDYSPKGEHLLRLHFLGYGEEQRPLRYKGVEDGVAQVALGHNNYTITGVTNWFYSKGGLELSSLGNLKDVSWLISGHIHLPSPDIYSQTIQGNDVNLFYPGAVTRVATNERYDDCFFFYLYSDEDGLQYDIAAFGLQPATEVFHPEKTKEELDEEEAQRVQEEEERAQRLSDILQEAMDYRIVTGDLISQIDNLPYATPASKDLAKGYLQKAIDHLA